MDDAALDVDRIFVAGALIKRLVREEDVRSALDATLIVGDSPMSDRLIEKGALDASDRADFARELERRLANGAEGQGILLRRIEQRLVGDAIATVSTDSSCAPPRRTLPAGDPSGCRCSASPGWRRSPG